MKRNNPNRFALDFSLAVRTRHQCIVLEGIGRCPTDLYFSFKLRVLGVSQSLVITNSLSSQKTP